MVQMLSTANGESAFSKGHGASPRRSISTDMEALRHRQDHPAAQAPRTVPPPDPPPPTPAHLRPAISTPPPAPSTPGKTPAAEPHPQSQPAAPTPPSPDNPAPPAPSRMAKQSA